MQLAKCFVVVSVSQLDEARSVFGGLGVQVNCYWSPGIWVVLLFGATICARSRGSMVLYNSMLKHCLL